jgi:hypothetical protein
MSALPGRSRERPIGSDSSKVCAKHGEHSPNLDKVLAERVHEPTTLAALVDMLATPTIILPSTSTGGALGLTVAPTLLACTDEANN